MKTVHTRKILECSDIINENPVVNSSKRPLHNFKFGRISPVVFFPPSSVGVTRIPRKKSMTQFEVHFHQRRMGRGTRYGGQIEAEPFTVYSNGVTVGRRAWYGTKPRSDVTSTGRESDGNWSRGEGGWPDGRGIQCACAFCPWLAQPLPLSGHF